MLNYGIPTNNRSIINDIADMLPKYSNDELNKFDTDLQNGADELRIAIAKELNRRFIKYAYLSTNGTYY